MKLERVCARSNTSRLCGRKLLELGPDRALLCALHGAAVSYFRSPDTGAPIEHACWVLFDVDARRSAALVIGDITLWEVGYEEQRGDERVRRARLMDLFVGEEFLLDGHGGTVIQQNSMFRSRAGKVSRTVVIMDAPRPLPSGHHGPMRLIGAELALPGESQVMRIMGVSPFVRPDRVGAGGSDRQPSRPSRATVEHQAAA